MFESFLFRSPAAVAAAVVLPGVLSVILGSPAEGAIYRWDNGELITEKNAEPLISQNTRKEHASLFPCIPYSYPEYSCFLYVKYLL